MPTVLLIFYLLTTPADKVICSLWTNTTPSSADLAAACGEIELDALSIEVTNVNTGQSACRLVGAAQIYQITGACQLSGRLDAYRLNIVEPNHVELLCSVETPYASPTPQEIAEQCGAGVLARHQSGALELRYISTKEIKPEAGPVCALPALQTGPGMLDGVKNAAELASVENYHLLSGKLLWFGYAEPSACENGMSGVNFANGSATACGMISADAAAYAWQNRLDESIFAASLEYNIPPRLLKELIARETQFWPWTGEHGEAGLIQLSDAGADVALSWFLDGYHRLRPEERAAQRTAYLIALRCDGCDVERAMRHAESVMPQYAQTLAAYRCQFGNWQTAMTVWNEKHINITGG